jgi:hypothetical protein
MDLRVQHQGCEGAISIQTAEAAERARSASEEQEQREGARYRSFDQQAQQPKKVHNGEDRQDGDRGNPRMVGTMGRGKDREGQRVRRC